MLVNQILFSLMRKLRSFEDGLCDKYCTRHFTCFCFLNSRFTSLPRLGELKLAKVSKLVISGGNGIKFSNSDL